MINSTYYNNLYKQKKSAIKSYDGNLKDLRKALTNLTDTMYDEIRAVNGELDDLKSDLAKGIRHNAKFSSQTSSLSSKKEKAVNADPFLSVVIRELQEEIDRVSRLKNQAVQDRDNYYNQYRTKKEEERQALLDKIF